MSGLAFLAGGTRALYRERPDGGRQTPVSMATRRDTRLLGASVPGEARARGLRGGASRGLRGPLREKVWPFGLLFTGIVAFLGKTRDVEVLPDAAHSLGASLQGCGRESGAGPVEPGTQSPDSSLQRPCRRLGGKAGAFAGATL